MLNQMYYDSAWQSPCASIKSIQLSNSQWILKLRNGSYQPYEETNILIHNELFQLIRLRSDDDSSTKSKLIVLFNDQIPHDKLQLLHLKQLK